MLTPPAAASGITWAARLVLVAVVVAALSCETRVDGWLRLAWGWLRTNPIFVNQVC